jgi:arylsulfatase A-like enzyme
MLSTGATVAGLALGVHGWRALVERSSRASLPAAAAGAPNVLLIVLDTVRAQSLSLYTYKKETTPFLKNLASRGVTFEQAFSSAPWTLPSHSTMFTGRHPHELSANFAEPLDATYPTLAEAFRGAGYATAGFVANLLYCCRHFGLARGFTHYEDYPISAGQVVVSGTLSQLLADRYESRRLARFYDFWNRKPAELISQQFLDWLPKRGASPYFAFLNYFDAHMPYLPPSSFDGKFGPKRSPGHYKHVRQRWFETDWLDMQRLSPEQVQAEIAAYDGSVAYLDEQLRRLFGELEERDELKNTLVVIVADHGEQLGEHDLFDHGNSVYLPVLHVPLLLLFPDRLPYGVRVPQKIGLRDLAATIVDLAGTHTDIEFPGNSLARFWKGTSPPACAAEEPLLAEHYGGWIRELPDGRWYPNWHGKMRSLIRDRFQYIKYEDGTEELYDIDADRNELTDLVKAKKGARMLERFRAELGAMVGPERA